MKTRFLSFLFFACVFITYSQQNVVADLEYIRVTINGTAAVGSNTISSNTYTFNAANDVGRLIAIKQAFHNGITPNTSLEFTKPGRIVTATATIESVNADGTATIAFRGEYYEGDGTIAAVLPNPMLNQSGTRQAYIYTNNYVTLQGLLDTGVDINLQDDNPGPLGIVGVNPIYNRQNENRCLVFNQLNNTAVTLNSTQGLKIKLCTEDIGGVIDANTLPDETEIEGESTRQPGVGEHHLFGINNEGNQVNRGNITVDISCVPPDVAGTTWRQFFPAVMHATFAADNTTNIIRDVTLRNLDWTPDDTGGNDSFWRCIYFNSGNGTQNQVDQTNLGNMQRFILESSGDGDGSVFQSVTGINYFSGDSNSSAVHIDGVTLEKISNFSGENGRDVYMTNPSDITSSKFNRPGQWRFEGYDFIVENGNKLTIQLDPNNPPPDFSFYDYPVLTDGNGLLGILLAPSGTLPALNLNGPIGNTTATTTANPNPNPYYGISNIIDAYTVEIGVPTDMPSDLNVVSESLSGTYPNSDFEIYYLKGDAFTSESEPGGWKVQKSEHAIYIHPHVSIDFTDFKVNSSSQDGLVKFFSAGNGGNGIQIANPPVYNKFLGCDFRNCQGLEFNGYRGDNNAAERDGYDSDLDPNDGTNGVPAHNGVNYEFTDCSIKSAASFYVGSLSFTNTYTQYPSVFSSNVMTSGGMNEFEHRGFVYGTDDANDINDLYTFNDTFRMDVLSIEFLEEDIKVHLDSTKFEGIVFDDTPNDTINNPNLNVNTHVFLPKVLDGELKISNNRDGDNQSLRRYKWGDIGGAESRYFPYSDNSQDPIDTTSDTKIIFENVTFNGIPLKANGNRIGDFFLFGNLLDFSFREFMLNMHMEFTNVNINNYQGHKALPQPSFPSVPDPIDAPNYNGLFKFTPDAFTDDVLVANRAIFNSDRRPYHLREAGIGFKDLCLYRLNVLESNKFTLPLTGGPANLYAGNIVILDFNKEDEDNQAINVNNSSNFRDKSWSNNAYISSTLTDGTDYEFEIIFENHMFLSPYHFAYISNDFQDISTAPFVTPTIDSERTLSNLVLSHINREPLDSTQIEVVTFRVDPKQNKIIEVGSNVSQHATPIEPTRLGLKDELLYQTGTTNVWRYDMNHVNVTEINQPYTATEINSRTLRLDNSEGLTDDDGNIIPAYFSILQELPYPILMNQNNGDWDEFRFTVSIDGQPVNFKHTTRLRDDVVDIIDGVEVVNGFDDRRLDGIHRDYTRHWWTFEGVYIDPVTQEEELIECYMRNRGGLIIFRDNNLTLGNEVTVTQGWEVIDQKWVLDSDNDRDGIVNAVDLDDDNDGIVDTIENNGINPFNDEDNDGTPDFRDPDAANFIDANNDGISDTFDFDNDRIIDQFDIDADGDGIQDNIEGQATVDYLPPSETDADNNGVDDTYDANPVSPIDTDGDTIPDYKDVDADGDGDIDNLEAYDTSGNGVIDAPQSDVDSDYDGLDNAYDTIELSEITTYTNPTDEGETAESFPDDDNPGGDRDWREVNTDTDPDAGDNTQVTICENEGSINLFNLIDGTPDAGGTWSPLLQSGNDTFDPIADGAGNYDYTVTLNGQTATSTITITILNTPNSGSPSSGSTCTDSINLFSLLSNYDSGGNWTPSIPNDIFNPNDFADGDYTFHYTVTNDCGSSTSSVSISKNCGNQDCVDDLHITQDVANTETDNKQAAITIVASNEIESGGRFSYHAGSSVTLTTGFWSKSGSKGVAYIEGCTDQFKSPENEEEKPQETSLTDLKSSIYVVPNPTTGIVSIKTTGKMLIDEFQLFSVTGNQLLQKTNNQNELDISSFPDGVYFLRITTSEGTIVKKIIKK